MLNTNVSCHDKIFKIICLEIREKFHFKIWANIHHSKIFNSVEFQISKNSELTLMSLPLKRTIIQENR